MRTGLSISHGRNTRSTVCRVAKYHRRSGGHLKSCSPIRIIVLSSYSCFRLIYTYKKREIRARHSSHSSGRRTCHIVKISNFEAHADMCIVTPKTTIHTTPLQEWLSQKGMRINTSRGHLPLLHIPTMILQMFDV